MSRDAPTLLLINPRFPESFWSFSWTFEHVIPTKRTNVPPLGLATLAALTPEHWQIRILDENVEPIDWNIKADIVGVCGMSVQYQRQIEILTEFSRRGAFIVAGGSFASLCPEKYTELCDSVIAGEAEYIWPRFCADYQSRRTDTLYKESGDVALTDSPVPRHDLIQWKYYLAGTVQFSRGCPFRCEFCDIIVTFGRKPRSKSLQQIEAELDSLRAQGVRNIVFVDDNLVGNLPSARKLLQFLINYQSKHDYSFCFGTEATVNVTAYPDVMRLLRKANFAWIFVGIESPVTNSLVEIKKDQNTRSDLVESVRDFYRHGMDVFGGFIVGFDNDHISIFDKQYEFIVKSGIIIAMVGQLYAPPKTPLYERLQKDNRIRQEIGEEATLINAGAATNVIPLNMTSEQLQDGCWSLHKRLLQDEMIYQRIRNKLKYLSNPVNYYFPPKDWAKILFGLFWYGIIPGGWARWKYFILSLCAALRRPLRAPQLIKTVIADWANALPLKMYADKILVKRQQQRPRFLFDQLLENFSVNDFPFLQTCKLGVGGQQIELTIAGDLHDQSKIKKFAAVLRKELIDGDQILLRVGRIDEHSIATLILLIRLFIPLRHLLHIHVGSETYACIREELWSFSYRLESALD